MTHAYSDIACDGGDDYLAFPVYRPTPDLEGLNSRYNTPKNSPPQHVNMTHAYSDIARDGGDDYLAGPVYRPTPDPEGLNSRYNTPKLVHHGNMTRLTEELMNMECMCRS